MEAFRTQTRFLNAENCAPTATAQIWAGIDSSLSVHNIMAKGTYAF